MSDILDVVSFGVSKHFPDATGFLWDDQHNALQICKPGKTYNLSEIFDGNLHDFIDLYATHVKWHHIRQRRNVLLDACDHTALEDYPRLQAQWQQYRQSLRDITVTFSNPDQVVWPEPPESLPA